MPMTALFLLLVAVVLFPLGPLSAQWQLSLLTGASATAGHARAALDPEQTAILPDHPVSWGLRLAREYPAWRVSLDGSRITGDLAIRGRSTSLVTRDALAAWGVGLELARRLRGRPDDNSLWAGLGAVAERWSFDVAGGDPRWRGSLRGSLQLDVPLIRGWNGLVRAEASVGASLFRADELPEGYRRRPARRAGMQLGVTRRW
jgi:hypothetical protein